MSKRDNIAVAQITVQEEDGNILTYKQFFPDGIGKTSDISDGYHTFEELYHYRMLYNAAFFNESRWHIGTNTHKSWRHSDGEKCFGGGWFIVMTDLPTGQISNHYSAEHWDLFKIEEREMADKWDGHTPQEAAERLEKYLRTEDKK